MTSAGVKDFAVYLQPLCIGRSTGGGTCGTHDLVRGMRHAARIPTPPHKQRLEKCAAKGSAHQTEAVSEPACPGLVLGIAHRAPRGATGRASAPGRTDSQGLESCSPAFRPISSSCKVCQFPSSLFPAYTCMCTCMKFPSLTSPSPHISRSKDHMQKG